MIKNNNTNSKVFQKKGYRGVLLMILILCAIANCEKSFAQTSSDYWGELPSIRFAREMGISSTTPSFTTITTFESENTPILRNRPGESETGMDEEAPIGSGILILLCLLLGYLFCKRMKTINVDLKELSHR